MAERVDAKGTPPSNTRTGDAHISGEHAAAAPEDVRADGSAARPHTQDGRLTHDDVVHAPIVDGTDPLSDDAIDRRRGKRSVTPQLVVFSVLALVFVYLLAADVAHGDWGKAALGVVVIGICAYAIRRELRERR